jgi:hypothetical protein
MDFGIESAGKGSDMKRTIRLAAIAMSVLFAAEMAQADSITAGSAVMVVNNGSNDSYSLSLFDGKAAYKPFGSSTSTTLGDGTLLDYRLVTSSVGAFNAAYATGAGSRIAAFTAPAGNIGASVAEDSWAKIWTSNDPGTNFSSVTPNYTEAQITHARANRANGTIDISGLTEGKLYFVHGSFAGTTDFSLTMSGTGQTDLTVPLNVASPGTTNRGWITDFNFDNTSLNYDTISFTYATNDSVTRGRFMGVAMDAIPEPATLSMIGVVGIAMLLRRRIVRG